VSAVLEGALFLFQQPLALLVLAVVLLLVHDLEAGAALAALVLFIAGGAACLVLQPAGWQRSAAAAFVALGGIGAAIGWAPRRAPSLAAAGLGGLAAGAAASLPLATVAEALGILAMAGLLLAGAVGALRLARRLVPQPHWRLALRILGSWMGAIGLLLLALSVARLH
jgi:hypothetical protein